MSAIERMLFLILYLFLSDEKQKFLEDNESHLSLIEATEFATKLSGDMYCGETPLAGKFESLKIGQMIAVEGQSMLHSRCMAAQAQADQRNNSLSSVKVKIEDDVQTAGNAASPTVDVVETKKTRKAPPPAEGQGSTSKALKALESKFTNELLSLASGKRVSIVPDRLTTKIADILPVVTPSKTKRNSTSSSAPSVAGVGSVVIKREKKRKYVEEEEEESDEEEVAPAPKKRPYTPRGTLGIIKSEPAPAVAVNSSGNLLLLIDAISLCVIVLIQCLPRLHLSWHSCNPPTRPWSTSC
jgi:hypothetical protein